MFWFLNRDATITLELNIQLKSNELAYNIMNNRQGLGENNIRNLSIFNPFLIII